MPIMNIVTTIHNSLLILLIIMLIKYTDCHKYNDLKLECEACYLAMLQVC